MQIIEVKNKQDWALFHQVLTTVYQNNIQYIYPLKGQIEETFRPEVNQAAAEGVSRCFVLLDENNIPVGRIAAFLEAAKSDHSTPCRLGGIGFFECIENREYAHALFEKAAGFLKQHQVTIIEGPINFGERDRYWGLLVKGFDPPLYQENYHPPYYQSFFLTWGFLPFEQILTFKGNSADIPFERLKAVANRLKSRYPVEVRPLDIKKADEFAQGFSAVYNASFEKFDHFKPIQPAQIIKFIEQAKLIVDPHLACIAYYDGVPAGFIALYPDINPFLKKARGKLNLLSLPAFLIRNKFAKQKIAKGMGFGVHPAYQSKGIFALLVDYLCTPRNIRMYPKMYLAQIRTHNHEIRSMYAKLGVSIDRVHVTYRKALENGITIEPFEFIEV